MKYKVVERFTSINGEGLRQGCLCTFIRFAGCNLRCKYCDSTYAYDGTENYTLMDENEIVSYCMGQGANKVMLAGGEPLYQRGILLLIKRLCEAGFDIEIETNGSLDIREVAAIRTNRPHLTLDYKTEASGMEHANLLSNYQYLTKDDAVKFVVGSSKDLDKMVSIVERYGLIQKTNVLVSPVWDEIDVRDIVDYMRSHRLNGYKLQLQIHKYIWDAFERGV